MAGTVRSELEEQLRKARGLALGIVAGQLGLTLLVAAAGVVLGGPTAGLSVLLGGGIGTLASLYMVVVMFRLGTDPKPEKILSRVYRGEFYKLLITAGSFALVLLTMEVSFGPMLGGLAATLVVYWAALGLRLTG